MLTAHKAGFIASAPHLMLQDRSRLLHQVTLLDQAHQENKPPLPCSTCGRESQRPYKPFSEKERYSVLSNLVSRIYSHPCNAVLASDAPQQGCLLGGQLMPLSTGLQRWAARALWALHQQLWFRTAQGSMSEPTPHKSTPISL